MSPIAYPFLWNPHTPGYSTTRVKVRLQGFSPSWRLTPPKAWWICFTPPALMGFTLQSFLLPGSSTPFDALAPMLLGTTPVFRPAEADQSQGSLQLRSFAPPGSTCLTTSITLKPGGGSPELFPLKLSPASSWYLLPDTSPHALSTKLYCMVAGLQGITERSDWLVRDEPLDCRLLWGFSPYRCSTSLGSAGPGLLLRDEQGLPVRHPS